MPYRPVEDVQSLDLTVAMPPALRYKSVADACLALPWVRAVTAIDDHEHGGRQLTIRVTVPVTDRTTKQQYHAQLRAAVDRLTAPQEN